MFCKNCGMKIEEEEKFCKNCGTSVDNVVDASYNKNKVSFGKTYLKIVLITIAFWIIMNVIVLVMNVSLASQNGGVLPDNSIVNLLNGLTIFVSIIGIVFGWAPALIYTSIKNSK